MRRRSKNSQQGLPHGYESIHAVYATVEPHIVRKPMLNIDNKIAVLALSTHEALYKN